MLQKKILGLCIREQPELQVTSGAAPPSLISYHRAVCSLLGSLSGLGGWQARWCHQREERVHGLATRLPVTSPSQSQRPKPNPRPTYCRRPWLLRGAQLQLPLRPEKESPAPVTSETIGPTKPSSVTRHHKGCLEGSGPPCSGSPDSRVCW